MITKCFSKHKDKEPRRKKILENFLIQIVGLRTQPNIKKPWLNGCKREGIITMSAQKPPQTLVLVPEISINCTKGVQLKKKYMPSSRIWNTFHVGCWISPNKKLGPTGQAILSLSCGALGPAWSYRTLAPGLARRVPYTKFAI